MKLFVAERGSEALIGVVEGLKDSEMAISALAVVEVRSGIRRREREKRFLPATPLQQSLRLEASRLAERAVTSAVALCAATIIDAHALRALDALQLATALVRTARNETRHLTLFARMTSCCVLPKLKGSKC
jgi:predicted nucleic acid-binding protein